MTHDEKQAYVIERLQSFLAMMTPPKTIATDADRARTIMGIADSICSKIAPRDAGHLAEIMDQTLMSVADGHESYAWPPQAAFIKALPFVAEPKRAEVVPDQRAMEIQAARIMRGEPVSDRYVFGDPSAEMARRCGQDAVDRYRRGLAKDVRDVYRDGAASYMASKYGEWSVRYLGA
jgi:hypothetical protein